MATITSQASGNWSSGATWIGGSAPGNGDTAIIAAGNIVTVDVDTTVGTSDVAGTAAITMQNTAQVVVAANHLLRVRGDIIGLGNFGGNTVSMIMQAGSILEFDSSLTVSPSTTAYVFGQSNNGFLTYIQANGTSGSHCTVRSNASGANGHLSLNGFSIGCGLVCTYTDFLRIGDAASPGAFPGYSTGLVPWDTQHCTFDTCGAMPGAGNTTVAHLDDVVRHIGNVHKNSLQTYCAYFSFADAIRNGARTITGNVFDVIFGNNGATIAAPLQATVNGNFFYQMPAFATGNWASFTNNLVRIDASLNLQMCGDFTDNYYCNDVFAPLHVHEPDLNAAVVSCNILRNVWDNTYARIDPLNVNDGIVIAGTGSNTTSVACKFNVVVPMGLTNGGASQALFDMLSSNSEIWDIEHNTLCSGGQAIACMTMEFVTSGVDHRGQVKNNIFWSVIIQSFALNADIEDPVLDLFDPAQILNNDRFHLRNTNPAAIGATNQGNSYINAWSVTPGGSDLVVDPEFLDTSRNLATFDTAYLHNVAIATWASEAAGHVFAVGDIISDTAALYYAGAVINYRCTTSHVKSTANSEPGAGSAWHTYWEFASWNSIRNAMAAGLTITDPILGLNNGTYIDALRLWVRYGFSPTNIALRGAATDGGDIGALPVLIPPLIFLAGNTPDGYLQIPYSHGFFTSGGIPPYLYSVDAGALPPGLTLNILTGVVSGIPIERGLFTFSVRVTDSIGDTVVISTSIAIRSTAQAGNLGGGGCSLC